VIVLFVKQRLIIKPVKYCAIAREAFLKWPVLHMSLESETLSDAVDEASNIFKVIEAVGYKSVYIYKIAETEKECDKLAASIKMESSIKTNVKIFDI